MNLSAPISITPWPGELEVMLFTRHLATMIKSGIPIAESLATLASQTKSAGFRKVINKLLADVDNGQTIASALTKHPKVFNKFYISLVEVSEKSGTLDENLGFIAAQLAKNYSLKKKIQTALAYPGIILTAALVMGGFIAFFVLPQLVDFFSAFDIELPLATRILLTVANITKDYGLFIALGLALLASLFRVFTRLGPVRPLWDGFLLKMPLFGEFLSGAQLAGFCRNLGVLIKSGVPITAALEITAGTLTNLKFSRDLLKIKESLSKGKNIAEAMEKGKYTQFPPLVYKMIQVGEKTGKLDDSLLYLGDFYEEEIDNLSKNLTTVLEPILLLGIGLLVGFVAVAIISPIYELTSSIQP